VSFYGLLRAFIINKFYVIGLRINIFSRNFNIDMNWYSHIISHLAEGDLAGMDNIVNSFIDMRLSGSIQPIILVV
jgi:hypothetical protein